MSEHLSGEYEVTAWDHDQGSNSLEEARAHMFRRLHSIAHQPAAQSIRRQLETLEARGLTAAHVRYLERQIDAVEDMQERSNHLTEQTVWNGISDNGVGFMIFQRTAPLRWSSSETGWGYTATTYEADWLTNAIHTDELLSQSEVQDERFPEKISVYRGTIFGIPSQIEAKWRAHEHGECESWLFQFSSSQDEKKFVDGLSVTQRELADPSILSAMQRMFQEQSFFVGQDDLFASINPQWQFPSEDQLVEDCHFPASDLTSAAYWACYDRFNQRLRSVPWTATALHQLFDHRAFTKEFFEEYSSRISAVHE